MRTRDAHVALLWLGSLLTWSCAREPTPPAEGETQVLAEFTGAFDPKSGKLTFERPAGTSRRGLSVVPVENDGTPEKGPENTIELVSSNASTDPATCGGVGRFCADVLLRSFHTHALDSTHVEITEMTPSAGFQAYNSAPIPLFNYDSNSGAPRLSNFYGLWNYELIAANGGSDTRTWGFNMDGEGFTFKGRVVARVVPGASDSAASSLVASLTRTHAGGTGLQCGGGGVETLFRVVDVDGFPVWGAPVTFTFTGTGLSTYTQTPTDDMGWSYGAISRSTTGLTVASYTAAGVTKAVTINFLAPTTLDQDASSVTVSSPTAQVGQQVTVRVQLRGQDGEPLSGVRAGLSVSGANVNLSELPNPAFPFFGPRELTDQNGVIRWTLSSSVAGTKTIQARACPSSVAEETLSDTAEVTFLP